MKDKHRKERLENIKHIITEEYGWALKEKPRKFLYFEFVKCSIIDSRFSFYRQLDIKIVLKLFNRSVTTMILEKYKQYLWNVSWQIRYINKLR